MVEREGSLLQDRTKIADELVASRHLSRYVMTFENEFMKVDVVWCRIAYSVFEEMIIEEVTHSMYELHYCLEGEVQMNVGGMFFVLHAGDFLIVPPGVHHSTLEVSSNVKKMAYAFEIEARHECVTETLASLSNICVWRGNERISFLIDMMLEYAQFGFYTSSIAIRDLYELLLLDCFKIVFPMQRNDGYKITAFEIDSRINSVKAYIRENLTCRVSVQDISDHMHLCPRQLNRIVKFETGKTVSELIADEKIKYIKRMIRQDMVIRDIAVELGYSSEYSLNRFFREKEGISIGKWRKSVSK